MVLKTHLRLLSSHQNKISEVIIDDETVIVGHTRTCSRNEETRIQKREYFTPVSYSNY